MNNSEKYFSNRECKYFPCHKVDDKDNFNCMFCFCPLYFLGDKCGGNFTMTATGKKSCINCTVPHNADNYELIMNKLKNNPIVIRE